MDSSLLTWTDNWQTHPLVGEGAPHTHDSNCQTEQISGHEIQSVLETKTDKLTDWLTASRSVTSTSTIRFSEQRRKASGFFV
jgi:hypothetical protein